MTNNNCNHKDEKCVSISEVIEIAEETILHHTGDNWCVKALKKKLNKLTDNNN